MEFHHYEWSSWKHSSASGRQTSIFKVLSLTSSRIFANIAFISSKFYGICVFSIVAAHFSLLLIMVEGQLFQYVEGGNNLHPITHAVRWNKHQINRHRVTIWWLSRWNNNTSASQINNLLSYSWYWFISCVTPLSKENIWSSQKIHVNIYASIQCRCYTDEHKQKEDTCKTNLERHKHCWNANSHFSHSVEES